MAPPASDPAGGYREYGVDAVGLEPHGYTSDVRRLTLVDNGWDDPDRPLGPTQISDYRHGAGKPHPPLRPPHGPLRLSPASPPPGPTSLPPSA